ncbi:MAG: hypothetical protein R3242_10065 [Akkermansiaceae bacterium]|nr:hypothetical protein [Akkermansiaceae bacterium]
MNTKEQILLEETIGSETVRRKVRTRTCIDVGLWWRKKPLWLIVTDHMVVLLAVSRRKHIEQVPLACCREVHYSPAGGELVITSDPALRFPRLEMPTSTALEVIDLIKQSPSPTPPQTNA